MSKSVPGVRAEGTGARAEKRRGRRQWQRQKAAAADDRTALYGLPLTDRYNGRPEKDRQVGS